MIGRFGSEVDNVHAVARSTKFYKDTDVQILADEYSIPAELLETFADGLQWSAERWYVCKHRPPVDVSSNRKALERMSRRVDDAVDALKTMPEECWMHVANAAHWIEPSPAEYMVSNFSDKDPSLQQIEVGVEVGFDDRPYRAPLSEIVAMLEAISDQASIANGMLRENYGKPGPKRDHAFNQWMHALRYVWTRTLGREFTYDAEAGAPISEAACFAVDAFKPLNSLLTNDEVRRKVRNYWEFKRKIRSLQS